MRILKLRPVRILIILATIIVGAQMRNVIGTADAANNWCSMIWDYQNMECAATPNTCGSDDGSDGYRACMASYNSQVNQCYGDAYNSYLACLGYIQ